MGSFGANYGGNYAAVLSNAIPHLRPQTITINQCVKKVIKDDQCVANRN